MIRFTKASCTKFSTVENVTKLYNLDSYAAYLENTFKTIAGRHVIDRPLSATRLKPLRVINLSVSRAWARTTSYSAHLAASTNSSGHLTNLPAAALPFPSSHMIPSTMAPARAAWPATACPPRAPPPIPVAPFLRHFSSLPVRHPLLTSPPTASATHRNESHASFNTSTQSNTSALPRDRSAPTNSTDPTSTATSPTPSPSTSGGSVPLSDLAAASLLTGEGLRALGIQLPSHCCGCGVQLQRRNPEAPGFFIIPARLLEPKEPRAEHRGDIAAAESWSPADEGAGAEAAEGEGEGVPAEEQPDVLCQRCFSLKHSGKIKVESAEVALPEFDLGKKVGRKICYQTDRRAVVLCVVDIWDFDGSLPRAALQSLIAASTGPAAAAAAGPSAPPSADPDQLRFQLMVAVNKFDLLPPEATTARVQQWVRRRLQQSGLPAPDKVFMVSAAKGLGVKEMVQDLRKALGFRGDLWVVGAQNAGKSSLINAMKRLAGTAGKGEPTVAPVPGTTLGLLQVPGLPLGPKQRAFDTPGVPHPHQLSTMLPLSDLKLLLPAKTLRGRTYRLSPGSTIFVGAGLARLDVMSAPGPTLYLTVFVSHHVNLHMGKTEGASERLPRLLQSRTLTPPEDPETAAALPPMEPIDLQLTGSNWYRSTVDIAIAGLGWVGVGCSGPASFRVWAPQGVAITTRDALIPDYASVFERPGPSTLLPKALPRAHAAARKEAAERAERRDREGAWGGGRVVSEGGVRMREERGAEEEGRGRAGQRGAGRGR